MVQIGMKSTKKEIGPPVLGSPVVVIEQEGTPVEKFTGPQVTTWDPTAHPSGATSQIPRLSLLLPMVS